MIRDIRELNFPAYATLSQATCTMQDMGEKTITTQVKIDGDITPDFSYDWAVMFKGEKYIHPLRKPQAAKENTSLRSVIDMTFQHWAIYQLKRWMMFTLPSVESGTAIADKYIASVRMNLGEFCDMLARVLEYYCGDAIAIDLNPEWEYDSEAVGVEMSYSYVWDVLSQLYDLYAVRWEIAPTDAEGKRYAVKVGYPAEEMDHIFEYGFKGGLLKVERQVQSTDIRNMLLGRGGEKNLPYRYYKDVDAENPTFAADPDRVPELKDIFFSELHGATFRSYIQGWKAKHYGGTAKKEDSYAPWAWERGYTDAKFNPVEYVKDDESIRRYGELMGGLDNNEDIFPTIQGVSLDGIGRVDEIVAAEEIKSDDVAEKSESDATLRYIKGATVMSRIEAEARKAVEVDGERFTVTAGQHANFDDGEKTITLTKDTVRVAMARVGNRWKVQTDTVKTPVDVQGVIIENAVIRIVRESDGTEVSASGIPEGDYRYRLEYEIYNSTKEDLDVTIAVESPTLTSASIGDGGWRRTWNVWIKNLWQSEKRTGESDTQYASRVWDKILGDHTGGEAKVVFSSGWLSTSEDYEFVITEMPAFDESKTLGDVKSHWRLTLAKCDADYDSLGVYIPSVARQAEAGDRFFFTGIDLPHEYVAWAEIRLDDWKKENLRELRDIKPTWVVTLDKVRMVQRQKGEAQTILDSLKAGGSLRLADKRFIVNQQGGAYETLYVQSVTYTYNEPKDKAGLIPDVEIALSDKYETVANPIATLNAEVSAIARQMGSVSNVEQVVRAVGDKLYLRKDGLPDRSMSATEFAGLLTSLGFRSGIVGGSGWGFFKDESGAWVLEADKVNVRQEMQVNSLVVNQITARGGMTVESAAALEIERVAEHDEDLAEPTYRCYFDTRGGSVANLFRVGDIAYCTRFDAENAELKYYKRKVTAVSENMVALAKLPRNPAMLRDYGVDGKGVPEAGDVIVQWGSYTDPTRRYVKVRDVIGGGYERYIEGLDSVKAEGTEYYFVGRQSGMYNGRPRFYLGDSDGFIEYKDGVLTVKAKLSVESTVGESGKTLGQVADTEIGGTNLILLSNTESRASSTFNYSTRYGLSEPTVEGKEYVLTVWGDDSAKESPRLELRADEGNRLMGTAQKVEPGLWRLTFTATVATERIFVRSATVASAMAVKIKRLKLEKGNVGTDWSPAPHDMESEYGYLKRALGESTTIAGGLVATSVVQLGYTDATGGYVTTAGVNGIAERTAQGGGVAFWGGSYILKDDENPKIDGEAALVLRMDGTGYLANGTIEFNNSELVVGNYLHLSPTETYLLQSDGNVGFSVKDAPIGYSPVDSQSEVRNRQEVRTALVTNDWYSDADHRVTVASSFARQAIALSTLGANAEVSARFTAEFAVNYGKDAGVYMANSGKVRVSVVRADGSVDGSQDFTAWSMASSVDDEGNHIYTYRLEVDFRHTVSEAGAYTLTVEGVNDMTEGGWSHTGTTSAGNRAIGATITTRNAMVKQNINGSDGFAAAWGQALVCVTAEGVLLRYGDHFIRLDKDGIHTSTN